MFGRKPAPPTPPPTPPPYRPMPPGVVRDPEAVEDESPPDGETASDKQYW